METISSLQNGKIKNLIRLLEKSKERKESGLFVVEGIKEVSMLLESNYEVVELFIHDKLDDIPALIRNSSVPKFIVEDKVFQKLAYRESTSGVVALAKVKSSHTLDDLFLKELPLVIAIEGLEKPGNLGAILRIADAAGVDAVILCEPNTDLYNPNTIRNSVGTFFTIQVAMCSNDELLSFLKKRQIQSYATAITTSDMHFQGAYKNPSAFIFGTESLGLSDFWLKNADKIIKIPMLGRNDSLNVSNSVAICVYEAIRQRSAI